MCLASIRPHSSVRGTTDGPLHTGTRSAVSLVTSASTRRMASPVSEWHAGRRKQMESAVMRTTPRDEEEEDEEEEEWGPTKGKADGGGEKLKSKDATPPAVARRVTPVRPFEQEQ